MRQHGDAKARDGGVELRDQIGAAEFGGDFWRDLGQVVQFGREQQFLDIADEAMPGQVATRYDPRRAIEIGRCGIEPEAIVEQLAPDDPAFLGHRQADRNIGLALRQAEQPRGGDELQIEIGIPLGEFHQPRGQEVAAEAVGGADPDRAGELGARAADRLLVGDDGEFHRFRAVGDALAGLGQEVSGLAAIEQFCREMPFQPVDTPDHCGMIDRKLLGGSGNRSAADDRQHETEVIPVDRLGTLRLGALIQHFRTSMVQYIGLVS